MGRSASVGLAATFLLPARALWACPACRPLVDARIYNASFDSNALLVLAPVALLLAIGGALHFLDSIGEKVRRAWRKGDAR